MKYLLDTNVCINYMRGKNVLLVQRFGTHPPADITLCAVVVAELFGEIRHALLSTGKAIGPYDMMIAAIALANNLILVTHNTSEFSRVPGLALEDWEIP